MNVKNVSYSTARGDNQGTTLSFVSLKELPLLEKVESALATEHRMLLIMLMLIIILMTVLLNVVIIILITLPLIILMIVL